MVMGRVCVLLGGYSGFGFPWLISRVFLCTVGFGSLFSGFSSTGRL